MGCQHYKLKGVGDKEGQGGQTDNNTGDEKRKEDEQQHCDI